MDGRPVHQQGQLPVSGFQDLRDAEEAPIAEFGRGLEHEGCEREHERRGEREEPGPPTDQEDDAADEQPADARLRRQRVGDDEGDHKEGRGDQVRQHAGTCAAEERAEVQAPAVRVRASALGATSASPTSAPTRRIGSSQTPGKTFGATSATNALASAPPSERIR